jgi:hypothetical protein
MAWIDLEDLFNQSTDSHEEPDEAVHHYSFFLDAVHQPLEHFIKEHGNREEHGDISAFEFLKDLRYNQLLPEYNLSAD